MIKPPHFSGIAFHDGIAEGDLTIPADDHLVTSANTDYRGAVKLFHLLSSKGGGLKRTYSTSSAAVGVDLDAAS